LALNLNSTSIGRVLNGEYKQLRGLRFSYQKDNILELNEYSRIYPKNRKSSQLRHGRIVDVFDLNGNFLNQYISVDKCARMLNITSRIIHKRLNSNYFDISDKYIFKYSIKEINKASPSM